MRFVLDLEKAGEGSRGGRVIGHTAAGKPIYASQREKLSLEEQQAKTARMKQRLEAKRAKTQQARERLAATQGRVEAKRKEEREVRGKTLSGRAAELREQIRQTKQETKEIDRKTTAEERRSTRTPRKRKEPEKPQKQPAAEGEKRLQQQTAGRRPVKEWRQEEVKKPETAGRRTAPSPEHQEHVNRTDDALGKVAKKSPKAAKEAAQKIKARMKEEGTGENKGFLSALESMLNSYINPSEGPAAPTVRAKDEDEDAEKRSKREKTPAEKKQEAKEKEAQKSLRKAGPYIGPRGGKWADPDHTIPWKEGVPHEQLEEDAHAAVKKDVIAAAHRAIGAGAAPGDIKYVGAGMEGIIFESGGKAYKVGRSTRRTLRNEAEAMQSLKGTPAAKYVANVDHYDAKRDVIVREMAEGRPGGWGTKGLREAYEAIAEELKKQDWSAPEYKEDSFIVDESGHPKMVDVGMIHPRGKREVAHVENVVAQAESKKDIDLLDVGFSIRNLVSEGHMAPEQARKLAKQITEHHGTEGLEIKQFLQELDSTIKRLPKDEGSLPKDMYARLHAGESLPSGWYLHGGKGPKAKFVQQLSRDVNVADDYGSRKGASVWAVRPKPGAEVVDFSDSQSGDMDAFVASLRERFEDEVESGEGPIAKWAEEQEAIGRPATVEALERQVRSEFAPKNIVDSAQAFDDPETFLPLLGHYPGGWPSLVRTPDGAVAIPGGDVEFVDLKALGKSMRFVLDLEKAGPFMGPRGGLWADLKHTIHWDPVKHGTERLNAMLAELVPSDKVQETAKQLAQLTKAQVGKLIASLNTKLAAIKERGEATPVGMIRWKRVLESAHVQAKSEAKLKAAKPPKPKEPAQLVFTLTETEAKAPEPMQPASEKLKAQAASPALLTAPAVSKLFEHGDEGASQAAADFVAQADSPRAKKMRQNALRKLGIVYSKGEWRAKGEAPVKEQKPKVSKPRERKKPEVSKAPQPRREHRDVGEVIGGARKHEAKPLGPRGSQYQEFAGMGDEELAKMARKDKLMDELNPAQMLAEGRDPGYVAVRATVEKMVPQKPKVANRLIQEHYIKGIAFLQKGLDRCESSDDIQEFIHEWKFLSYGMRKVEAIPREELYRLRDEKLKADGYELLMTNEEYEALDRQLSEVVKANTLAYAEYVKKPNDKNKKAHEETAQAANDLRARTRQYQYGNSSDIEAMYIKDTAAYVAGIAPPKTGKHTIREYADDAWEVESIAGQYVVYQRDPSLKRPLARGPFEKQEKKTIEQAEAAYNEFFKMAASMGDALIRTIQYGGSDHGKTAKKWKDARRLARKWERDESISEADKLKEIEKITARKSRASDEFRWRHTFTGKPERIGGKTVTKGDANTMMRDFGLRGVQFGKWINNEEAEHHLVAAHGAFYDLADVLGVDPKKLSLSGKLAIAFGARGQGWGAAHYEGDKEVINITKFAGGGSLAHEWGHAMDNILAKWGRPAGAPESYMTESGFRAVFLTMGDAPDADPDLIRALNRVQSYMTWGDADAYLKVQRLDELRDIPNHEKTEEQSEEHKRLYIEVKNLGRSEYRKASADMTQSPSSYWTDPAEMFARAFESYVHDKLQDDGRANTYLVSGTTREEIREAEKRTRVGTGEREIKVPYPEGAEREALKGLFDDLMGVVRERKLLKSMFVVFGLTDFDDGERFVLPL